MGSARATTAASPIVEVAIVNQKDVRSTVRRRAGSGLSK
jgi:hypothetical protein